MSLTAAEDEVMAALLQATAPPTMATLALDITAQGTTTTGGPATTAIPATMDTTPAREPAASTTVRSLSLLLCQSRADCLLCEGL